MVKSTFKRGFQYQKSLLYLTEDLCDGSGMIYILKSIRIINIQ